MANLFFIVAFFGSVFIFVILAERRMKRRAKQEQVPEAESKQLKEEQARSKIAQAEAITNLKDEAPIAARERADTGSPLIAPTQLRSSFFQFATPENRLKTTFKGTWLNRALSWLPWGVSFTIWMAIVIGATAGFIALLVSVLETGSVPSLIGAIGAGMAMVIGGRAFPHATAHDRMLFTVIFVLFLSLFPLGFAFACHNESIRVTLWVLGGLLLLGNGVYFVCSRRPKS